MSGLTIGASRAHKEKGNAANVAFENQINHWSGLSFDFSRCRCLSCFSTDFGSTCSDFFPTSVGGESLGSFAIRQSAESTLGFLHCRRLISPSIAITMNWAVLSPGSFTCSIACTTSCGARACTFCDFALMLSVATIDPHVIWWMPVYTKKNPKKVLWWMPVGGYSGCQLSVAALSYNKAPQDCSPNGASNHNVSWSNIMACSHDTQTRPEFTYLFLGTPSDKTNTTPVVLRAEANNEQQARSHFPGWNLVFAAQIRTKAPCRLHGCAGVKVLPGGMFDIHLPSTQSVNLTYTFQACTGLLTLPPGLFDAIMPNISTMYNTFNGCSSLTDDLTGLLTGTPKCTDFRQTFSGCRNMTGDINEIFTGSYPSGSNLLNLFSGCSRLTGSKSTFLEKFPSPSSTGGTFAGCPELTD